MQLYCELRLTAYLLDIFYFVLIDIISISIGCISSDIFRIYERLSKIFQNKKRIRINKEKAMKSWVQINRESELEEEKKQTTPIICLANIARSLKLWFFFSIHFQ